MNSGFCSWHQGGLHKGLEVLTLSHVLGGNRVASSTAGQLNGMIDRCQEDEGWPLSVIHP